MANSFTWTTTGWSLVQALPQAQIRAFFRLVGGQVWLPSGVKHDQLPHRGNVGVWGP